MTRRSGLNRARRATHQATVLLGDAQAVASGRVPQRAVNRVAGKALARALLRAWR